MSESDQSPAPKSSETDPPAANQPHSGSFPTTPDESAQSGSAEPGGDDSSESSGENQNATIAGPVETGAGGEQDAAAAAHRERIPTLAPPGKPDGEVDTRR